MTLLGPSLTSLLILKPGLKHHKFNTVFSVLDLRKPLPPPSPFVSFTMCTLGESSKM